MKQSYIGKSIRIFPNQFIFMIYMKTRLIMKIESSKYWGGYSPYIVFHAGVYSLVPLIEDSLVENIGTNSLGTYNDAKMLDKYKVKEMVLVSTDNQYEQQIIMELLKPLQNGNQIP